jgi:cytoskeleton protein RodZ
MMLVAAPVQCWERLAAGAGQGGSAVAFGERLQREREMRGITLEEIAKATKIGTRSLRALEEEDFTKLPGGIFNKGFVRAYARYVGIDEEQAITDYQAALGEPHDPALDGERLKKLEANWTPSRREALKPAFSPRIPWAGIGIVVVVIVVIGLGWHYRHSAGERWRQWRARRHPAAAQQLEMARQTSAAAYRAVPPESAGAPNPPDAASLPGAANPPGAASLPVSAQPAVATAGVPQATSTVAAVPPSNDAPDPAAPAAIVLQIRAREDSWVSVVADGKTVTRGVVNASGEKTVRAHNKLKLTVGNAGGVDLLLNGKPQPPLGEVKQTRTVTFTPEGMESRQTASE